jgi:hypothetical protein
MLTLKDDFSVAGVIDLVCNLAGEAQTVSAI